MGGFLDKVSELGKDVSQSAKELAEVTRLNSSISQEEKKMTGLYRQLGEDYYNAKKDAPDEAFSELVGQLKESEQNIANFKAQILVVKGQDVCQNCGEIVENDAVYCKSCGAKIERKTPEPEPSENSSAEKAAPSVKCGECGAENPEGSKFCHQCGKAL